MNVILFEQEGAESGQARPDGLARRLAAAGCDLIARTGDTEALEQILAPDASAGFRRMAMRRNCRVIEVARAVLERGLG